MQFVFDQEDLREVLMEFLGRFDRKVKIDFTKSCFSFECGHEYFTSLTQLALELDFSECSKE